MEPETVIHFLASNHYLGSRWYTYTQASRRTVMHGFDWLPSSWLLTSNAVSKYFPCAAVLLDDQVHCCCIFSGLEAQHRHSHGSSPRDTLIIEGPSPAISRLQSRLLAGFLATCNPHQTPLESLTGALKDQGSKGVALEPQEFMKAVDDLGVVDRQSCSNRSLDRGTWVDTALSRRGLWTRLTSGNFQSHAGLRVAIVTTTRHVSLSALAEHSWMYALIDETDACTWSDTAPAAPPTSAIFAENAEHATFGRFFRWRYLKSWPCLAKLRGKKKTRATRSDSPES